MSAPTDPIGPDNDLSQADALLAALIARGEERIRAIVHEEMEAARRAEWPQAAREPVPFDEDAHVEAMARQQIFGERLRSRIRERVTELRAVEEDQPPLPPPSRPPE
jgi:hypothetical protein